MERPPQHILDCFYQLAGFNEKDQLDAAKQLVEEKDLPKYKDYVLDRLIKGLASGKSGSRFGFSTALAGLFHCHPAIITANKFLKLVDEKLPLKGHKKERNANSVGQHLAFLSVYSAGVFTDSLREFINRHIAILEECPQLRLSFADAISQLCTNTDDEIFKMLMPSDDLLKLLELVESIESTDSALSAQARFSQPLISKLSDTKYAKFVKNALNQEQLAYKRFLPSFGTRSAKAKSKIFQTFIAAENKSSSLFNAACLFMERLFKQKYKVRHLVDVVVKPEDAEMLLTLLPPEEPAKKPVKEVNKPLEILASVLRFLHKMTDDEADAERYLSEANEVYELAQNLKGHSRELLDLTISIVTRTQKLHRMLGLYVVAKMHHLFDHDDIAHVVETLSSSEREIFGGEDDDEETDGEFKPITEEERRLIQEKWAAEDNNENRPDDDDDDESSDESAEESSEENEDESMETDEEDAEVDPELVSRMQKALGEAALINEDQSDIVSFYDLLKNNIIEFWEMDDEQIEELDKNLALALRRFTSHGRKEQVENLRSFRLKCIDLLNAYFAIASNDAVEANLDNLSVLFNFVQNSGQIELIKKASDITAMLVNRDKAFKKFFVKENSRFVPRASE